MADDAKRGGDDAADKAMDKRAADEKQPGNILAGVQPDVPPNADGKTERRED